jgi:hypothetical protein
MVAAVGSLIAAQPASAAVVVPAGRSGSACSGYTNVDADLYFQVCAWTSWAPPTSRIWFTAHFGNRSDSVVIVKVDLGYHINGSTRIHCGTDTFGINPRSFAATDSEKCWIPRTRAAVQASIWGTLSPTLQIQG